MAKAGYKEKRIRPVWPIALAGVVFVIYSAIFPIYRTSHFFIACILAAASFIVGTMLAPVKVEQVEVDYKTGNSDADTIIENGRKTAARLRAESDKITDYSLKQDVMRTERAITQMVDTVAQTPTKAGHVKKFINYYLPTIMKLLDAYDRFGEGGQTQNMAGIMQSIKESMKNVADASEKQLQNMFEDEELDISTDIEVLETMLKSDGLIGEDPFAERSSVADAPKFEQAMRATATTAQQAAQQQRK